MNITYCRYFYIVPLFLTDRQVKELRT